MAAQRLRVRQIRNVLKLHYENRLPQREIARVCRIGNGTVAECLRRARKVGLAWPLPEDLTDEALEQQLYRYRSGSTSSEPKPKPDLASMMVSTEPEPITERSFRPSWGLPERRPGTAAPRLRVRQIRNVLKLHYEKELPQREIARICGIGSGTVAECLRRARKIGLA